MIDPALVDSKRMASDYGAGHLTNLEAPGRVNALLARFFGDA